MMAENAGATPEAAEQKEGGIIDQRYYRGLLAIPKGVEVVSTCTAWNNMILFYIGLCK